MGRGEIGARQRAPPPPEAWSAAGRSLPFVRLAAKRAGEIARDGPSEAVPGGAREAFRRRPLGLADHR